MDLIPILSVICPFFRNIYHSQIQHFQEAVIRGKYSLAFCDFPELTVKSPDGICGVDQTTDNIRIFEIGRQIRPVVLVEFCDFRVLSALFFRQRYFSASAISSVGAAFTYFRLSISSLISL